MGYLDNYTTTQKVWGTIIIIFIIILLIWLYRNYYAKKDCVYAHKQSGDNYVWLRQLGHGNVTKIEFEEPVNSGNWKAYTDHWWQVHCASVSHNPNNLVQAHVNAFIGPNRFARLMFTFQDGTQMEPTVDFYILERDYFR